MRLVKKVPQMRVHECDKFIDNYENLYNYFCNFIVLLKIFFFRELFSICPGYLSNDGQAIRVKDNDLGKSQRTLG